MERNDFLQGRREIQPLNKTIVDRPSSLHELAFSSRSQHVIHNNQEPSYVHDLDIIDIAIDRSLDVAKGEAKKLYISRVSTLDR